MKNLTKAFTMVLVLIFLNGIASGKRVEAHIIVKRCSLPDFVFGNGPTQSIMILLKVHQMQGLVVTQLWV